MRRLALGTIALGGLLAGGCAQQPSFDCSAATGSVETLVCQQPDLAALDRRLARAFAGAVQVVPPGHLDKLQAEQRGWIKGRDDCWKSAMPIQCIDESYRYRIAELQSRFDLLQATGPFIYLCDDSEGDQVSALYYNSDPATAKVSRGDQDQILFLVPSGSGAKYEGSNIMLWTQGNEALIRWGFEGYGNPIMHCEIQP
ncbi:MliC family protein [Motiliproteus sediminis]|uniref:MliC family protein n=1 Tax=Motiliproteus sediminis TaxID=1468178 RepID=UPI001AEF9BA7|nr:MliC family protein [Motiliproteus sediminis]